MKAIPVRDCLHCPHVRAYEISITKSPSGPTAIAAETGYFCNETPFKLNLLDTIQSGQLDVNNCHTIPDWCPLPSAVELAGKEGNVGADYAAKAEELKAKFYGDRHDG